MLLSKRTVTLCNLRHTWQRCQLIDSTLHTTDVSFMNLALLFCQVKSVVLLSTNLASLPLFQPTTVYAGLFLTAYDAECFIVDVVQHYPGRGRRFYVPQYCPDRLWGLPSLIFHGYLCSFPRVRRPEHKVYHSSLSNAEVKNEWRYTSTLPVCPHDNFVFYLLLSTLPPPGVFFCYIQFGQLFYSNRWFESP